MNYPPNDDNQSQFPPPQQPNTSYPPQQPDTSYPLHQPNTYPYEPLQAPLPPKPPKPPMIPGWLIAAILGVIGGIICVAAISHGGTPTSSPDATATADVANVVVATDTPVPTTQPTEQPRSPRSSGHSLATGIRRRQDLPRYATLGSFRGRATLLHTAMITI